MRTDRALGLEFDDVGTRFKHGCIVSCILLGAFLGALASSACADRYGRRKATPPLNVQRPAAPPPPSPAAAPTTVIATFSVPLTPWAGLLIQLGILHRWPTRCASSSASQHARAFRLRGRFRQVPFTESGSFASFDPCRHLSASRLSALSDGLFPCYAQPARPVLPSPRHRRLRARRQRRMRLRAPSTRRRPCSAAQRNATQRSACAVDSLSPKPLGTPRNPYKPL
jgi:hypothetical protein